MNKINKTQTSAKNKGNAVLKMLRKWNIF